MNEWIKYVVIASLAVWIGYHRYRLSKLVRTQTRGSARISTSRGNNTEEFQFYNRSKSNRNVYFEFKQTIYRQGICGDLRVPPRKRPCTPYRHVHVDQTEKFTLLQGQLTYQLGDTIHSCDVHTCPSPLVIPPLVPHTFWMTDNREDLVLLVRVEPAFETHGFRPEALENIMGVRLDNHMTIWQAFVFIHDIEAYPASLPLFLCRLLFQTGASIGHLLGYQTEYEEYTT